MSWRETQVDNFLDKVDVIFKPKKLRTDKGRFITLKKLTETVCEYYDNTIYLNEGIIPVPGVIYNRENGRTALAILNLDTNNQFDIHSMLILTTSGVKDTSDENIANIFNTFEYWYAPLNQADRHIRWDACPAHIRKMYDKILPCIATQWL